MLLMNRLLNAFLFVACLLSTATAFAQSKTVTGKITGFNFGPLEGASIIIKGKNASVLSNNFGDFKIIALGTDTLVISFVDYEKKEVAISGHQQLNIVLQPERINLDSVVVIGYGVQKKRDVTGAISSIKGE